MLLLCGGLVNGPYALITTAVSADLVRTDASWEALSLPPVKVSLKQHSLLHDVCNNREHTRASEETPGRYQR